MYFNVLKRCTVLFSRCMIHSWIDYYWSKKSFCISIRIFRYCKSVLFHRKVSPQKIKKFQNPSWQKAIFYQLFLDTLYPYLLLFVGQLFLYVIFKNRHLLQCSFQVFNNVTICLHYKFYGDFTASQITECWKVSAN